MSIKPEIQKIYTQYENAIGSLTEIIEEATQLRDDLDEAMHEINEGEFSPVDADETISILRGQTEDAAEFLGVKQTFPLFYPGE